MAKSQRAGGSNSQREGTEFYNSVEGYVRLVRTGTIIQVIPIDQKTGEIKHPLIIGIGKNKRPYIAKANPEFKPTTETVKQL